MAKAILNLSNYSGGLNNKTNSKDIEDNQFQNLDTLSIETPGKLSIMGAVNDLVSINSRTLDNEENLVSSISHGNGLFHFNSDYDITDDSAGNTETLLINSNVSGTEQIKILDVTDATPAYATKTLTYNTGAAFEEVVMTAIDGSVRVVSKALNDNSRPQRLAYIKANYDYGDSSVNAHIKKTIAGWQVFSPELPAASSYITVNNAGLTDTLVENISTLANNATAFTSADGNKYSQSQHYKLSTEIIKVTNVSGNTITIEREAFGTSAVTISTSTPIYYLHQLTHATDSYTGGTPSGKGNGQILRLPNNYQSSADGYGKLNFNFHLGKNDPGDGDIDNDAGQLHRGTWIEGADNVINFFSQLTFLDGQEGPVSFEKSMRAPTAGDSKFALHFQIFGRLPNVPNLKSIKIFWNETTVPTFTNFQDITDETDKVNAVKFLLFEVDLREGLRISGDDSYKQFYPTDTGGASVNDRFYQFPNANTDHSVSNGSADLGHYIDFGASLSANKITNVESVQNEVAIEPEKNIMYQDGTGYKTSVVANRRMFIGNVRYKDPISGDLLTKNDTIFKSNVNKFDQFEIQNRIEVEVNDGDDIIKLESLGPKLLEFKQNHLYIINIAREVEFLEASQEYKGVIKDCHVVKGEGFIAWFNKYGFYLYDGKQLRDLLMDGKGQQRLEDWKTNYYHDNAIIGYEPIDRTIVIANKTNQNILCFDIKSGALYHRSKGASTNDISNFITTNEGDLVFFERDSGTLKLRKWALAPSKLLGTTKINEVALKTKEFAFGKPSVDKKIISVYLSYKNGYGITLYGFREDGEEEILATLEGDAETDFKTLRVNMREAKTEFVDKKAFNSVKSFGLRLSGSDVATDFEINDIQVVFREKSVK